MEENIQMYQGWAEIVMKLFRRKIQDYEVWESGQLFDSLAHHVVTNANGDVGRIEFFFNYYGRFVDMGTGREFYIGNPGDIGFRPKRKRKPWYSKVFWGNMRDLVRIVSERYGEEAGSQIKAALQYAPKDFKNEYMRKHRGK